MTSHSENVCLRQIQVCVREFHRVFSRSIGSFGPWERTMKKVLWFALGLLVGLAAFIRTILAMFAWNGASV